MKQPKFPIESKKNDDLMATFHKEYNGIYEKILKEQSQKKEEIVRKRLKDLGIEFDLEEEKRRRFKRLIIETNHSSETLYFNDGSEEGIRVVTFTRSPPVWDTECYKVTWEETYY